MSAIDELLESNAAYAHPFDRADLPSAPAKKVAVCSTRAKGWISRAFAWRLDPLLMRLSGGRLRFGLLLPTALLETRGARTGALRRNGVIYFHDGDRVVIVASKLGLPQHPAWFHNLRSNPHVRLGGRPFRAEVITDDTERARLWDLADRVFP